MKKLLQLLGTILVTGNALGSLVANKSNNNRIKNNLQILNRQKRQVFNDLHFAIHENDIKKVKFLLLQSVDVNKEDEQGWIPLFIAIKNNNLNIVQELLTNENSKNKININIKNKFDQTALHFAAQENNTEIANLLFDNDANINVINDKSQTPLHIAVQNGNLAMVNLLLDYGVATDVIDDDGNTALMLAENTKYLDIIKLLLKNKTNNDNVNMSVNGDLNLEKRQTSSADEENQQAGNIRDSQDVECEFIEKEITLDKSYAEDIQNMLQELIDENYIDPLRSINMGGLISKELDNKTIISKLEELEPKMAGWFKKQQNNKDKILILTLKNSNNKSIKLVINLNNFYLLGFINNQNQYFYFDDELLKKYSKKMKMKLLN